MFVDRNEMSSRSSVSALSEALPRKITVTNVKNPL